MLISNRGRPVIRLQLKKSQKFPTTSVDYFSPRKIKFEQL